VEPSEVRRLMEEQLKLSRKLKARIQELEAGQRPELAVVGMAMRLPGGLNTPDAYWRFLRTDSLALSEIPEDRPGLRSVYSDKRDQPGRSYVARAGFLRDIASFDAGFFGINAREAEALDPQQRLLLETAWEALERAGIAVQRHERLSAGVFVGIMASEYGDRLTRRADKSCIDPYYGTGSSHCFAAGRISYALGLSGPALSIDTACSSSLVALHLAVQSLRRGECRYALVAGTNLLLSADLMVSLSASQALSPEGRSKTFTAQADGYGRGEGVGVLVLQRLDDALREGRPVLALVRGTAVNHDGASSGLTVPSGPAQQEVIRAALRDAQVAPEELGYVEAHGTGTALGDPIEVGALDAVLGSGAGPRNSPLVLGSVKSRIGHLEAAAGVAGLIKVVLMLQHGQIPAALSESDGELNQLVPWQKLNLVVPRRNARWPAALQRRVAGISAFGLSGTNAHVVLEAYDDARLSQPSVPARGQLELITLSAKEDVSLRELASQLVKYLGNLDPARLPAVCHTLRSGRAQLRQRIAVLGETAEELARGLYAALSEHPAPAVLPSGQRVRLRVGADDAIAAGLSALEREFPALSGQLEGSMSTRLERLFLLLGVTVERAAEPAQLAHGALAQLEWGSEVHVVLAAQPERAAGLLLTALAALFKAGVDLKLHALARSPAPYVWDLPTYAFHRKRYWIDEAQLTSALPQLPSQPAQLQTDTERVPAQQAEPQAQPSAASDVGVEAFISAALHDVLGADTGLDLSQTFLAVGGDSFTAMLLKKSIEQECAVEIPLDALTTELRLDQLIAHVAALITAGRGSGQE